MKSPFPARKTDNLFVLPTKYLETKEDFLLQIQLRHSSIPFVGEAVPNQTNQQALTLAVPFRSLNIFPSLCPNMEIKTQGLNSYKQPQGSLCNNVNHHCR